MYVLKSGDALLVVGNDAISKAIEIEECGGCLPDGTRPSHMAMYVNDRGVGKVFEMTWPRLQVTAPADSWLAARAGTVWLLPLAEALTYGQRYGLCDWWTNRLGMWYDVPEMIALGWYATWAWWLKALHLPASWAIPPVAINGVCSVNCAMAWNAIGLNVGDPLVVTPSSAITLPCVGVPVKL